MAVMINEKCNPLVARQPVSNIIALHSHACETKYGERLPDGMELICLLLSVPVDTWESRTDIAQMSKGMKITLDK